MNTTLGSIARRSIIEIALVGGLSFSIIVCLQVARRDNAGVSAGFSTDTPLVRVGSKISINATQFGGKPLSLLLVSSPACHFCQASKGFHKRLLGEADKHRVPIFISVPNRSSSSDYVRDFHLPSARLKQWKDVSVAFQGTPTLVAINSAGICTRLWVGELSPAQEDTVLELIRSGSAGTAATTDARVEDFSVETVENMRRRQSLELIDIRERSEVGQPQPGVENIPLQEIPFRIADGSSTLHLIDCRGITIQFCDYAVQTFEKQGLRVGTVGRGTYHESWCRVTQVASASRN